MSLNHANNNSRLRDTNDDIDDNNDNSDIDDAPIQPVTTRFPVSQDLWDDTNLPFSCVLTPLAATRRRRSRRRHQQQDGGGEEEDADDDDDEEQVESLSSIPKCLHCGAPHASNDTHFRPSSFSIGGDSSSRDSYSGDSRSVLLCYLCGKVSSTSFREQEEKRSKLEGTLLAGVAATSSKSKKTKKKKKNAETHGSVFELPLRLSSSQQQHQHHSHHHHQQHSQAIMPIFSVPAVSCPLLWFVVLDDSCTNPIYWHTVSQLLLDTVTEIPDYVHVSILLARQREDDDGEYDEGGGGCSLGVYQLTSPIPHVKHIHSTTTTMAADALAGFVDGGGVAVEDDDDRAVAAALVLESLTEASSHNKPHIQSACRSLLDYVPSIRSSLPQIISGGNGERRRRRLRGNRSNNNHHRFALSWTLELITQALQTYGQAAGQRSDHNTFPPSSLDLLSYAGGKITCLPASRPAQVATTSTTAAAAPSSSRQRSTVNFGGFGGRIAPAGERFVDLSSQVPYPNDDDDDNIRITSTTSDEEDAAERGLGKQKQPQQPSSANGGTDGGEEGYVGDEEEEFDLTPSSLQDLYEPPPLFGGSTSGAEVVSYYDELGRQCAQSAMGVDILCLSCYDEGDEVEEDFALPLYGIVSQKSGAPGPMLFYLSSQLDEEEEATSGILSSSGHNSSNAASSSLLLLRREFKSRTPWGLGSNLVFGAELRLRLPPGYGVDDSSVERSNEQGAQLAPQLAPLYADKGLLGPGSAVLESTNLWRFGCADPWTTVTIDLMLQQRNIKTQMFVDGLGDVQIKPVIQTCFAYTTVLPDDNNSNDIDNDDATGQHRQRQYRTVRQMRIHSTPVPFAKMTETIYASIDTSALSVVLFHKLALAALQDGYLEACMIAEDWLQSTLTSIYQSAEQYVATNNTNNNGDNAYTSKLPSFYANERLLDRQGGGELSDEDVLLAQGHERLRTIPLMTYLLMQCDAFRPTPAIPGSRSPSLDLRYAAMQQMMSMSPSILTRCIAPRIQLWSSAKDEKEAILDSIDLSTGALRSVVGEFWENNDLIVVIDAPEEISVIDGQYIGPAKSEPSSSSLPLVMGAALKRSIMECAMRHRTRPSIVYELSYNEAASDRVIKLLTDVLIEDAPGPTGQHENYREWKSDMANGVKEELENDSSDPLK